MHLTNHSLSTNYYHHLIIYSQFLSKNKIIINVPMFFQIQTQKIDIKAESKIGSLDNVKHKPGGGDKKIFNDKEYLRQTGTNPESLCGSGSQVRFNFFKSRESYKYLIVIHVFK